MKAYIMEASAIKAAPCRGVEGAELDNVTRDDILVDAVEIDTPGAESVVRTGVEAEAKGKR